MDIMSFCLEIWIQVFDRKYGYNVPLSGNMEIMSFWQEIWIYKTEGLRVKDEGWLMIGEGGIVYLI